MALTQVKSDGIATGAVTATQIAANAVTVDDISDGSISTAKLADDAVTADKLADTAVTAGTYGSSSAIPSITVDAQGRITSASTNAISVESDRIFEGNTSAEVVDTGSNGHFKVVTEGTEALHIDSSQRVGIGATPSVQKLTVDVNNSNTTVASFNGINVCNTDNTTNNGSAITFSQFTNGNSFARIGAINTDRTNGSEDQDIFFGTIAAGSYSERMRIGSSGDVGINGTTNPNLNLTFANTSSRNAGIDYTTGSSDTNLDIISAGPSGGWKGRIRFFTSFSGTATEGMRLDENRNLQFNSGYGSVATAYGCRAWAHFDGSSSSIGSGTGSGNCSSITDLGTGTYRFNFTSAMPDEHYSIGASCTWVNTYGGNVYIDRDSGGTDRIKTTSFKFRTANSTNYSLADVYDIMVSVFR